MQEVQSLKLESKSEAEFQMADSLRILGYLECMFDQNYRTNSQLFFCQISMYQFPQDHQDSIYASNNDVFFFLPLP